jgi:hypothetical protein
MAGQEAFREAWVRHAGRQALTLGRALRAGRARAKATPAPPEVDGRALRDLVAEVAADARLVDVPVDRAPWTTTGLQVAAGEPVTWVAWGRVWVVKPLGIVAWPRTVLRARVDGGPVHGSARDTMTFVSEHSGQVELGSLFPGELRDDGSVVTDRIPYRAMRGGLAAVVARWAPGNRPPGGARGRGGTGPVRTVRSRGRPARRPSGAAARLAPPPAHR